jgi:hypothetical protein
MTIKCVVAGDGLQQLQPQPVDVVGVDEEDLHLLESVPCTATFNS